MTDLNFFSSYQKTKKTVKIELKNKEKLIFMVLGSIIAIMILISIYQRIVIIKYSSDIKHLNESLSEINSEEIEELLAKKISLDELNQQYAEVKSVKNEIENLEIINDKSLKAISSVLPDGIYFSGINFEKGEKLIKGIAKNNAYIAEFQNNLRKLPYFKDLFVPEITDNNGYYEFTIKIDEKYDTKIKTEEVE